jgi:hypothetical protein
MSRQVCYLVTALVSLTFAGSAASAASITAAGSDTDIGSSWRTASVPKTDPADTNVIGTNGWTAVGNGGSTVLPSYIASITTGSVYPGNSGYALIDNPLTTPGAAPSKIQNGTVSPGNSLDWTFTMSSTNPIPQKFQVAILVDNLDIAAYNSAATTISLVGSPSTTATITTTAPVYNDRSPDLLYFTIAGATAGEVFDVGGIAGNNGDITASVMAFDIETPEPGSVVALAGLCGMGLIGLVLRRRRAA